jgi:hypothetical protein
MGGTTLLDVRGLLDSAAYLPLRDKIIAEALEEPDVVLVNVSDLVVPAPSAWTAFTSASWHVQRWPKVPVALICGHPATRAALEASDAARRLSVYPTTESAFAAEAHARRRDFRRARADLPASNASLQRARELAAEWLAAWAQGELVAVVKIVVTALVENVLQHTDSRPRVRLETDGSAVAIAVEDSSRCVAGFRELTGPASPSGLRIVSMLSRMWGNAPTPSGKTVWAVVGPENRI